MRFFRIERETLHHASGVRSDAIDEYENPSRRSAKPRQNPLTVLRLHGILHGTGVIRGKMRGTAAFLQLDLLFCQITMDAMKSPHDDIALQGIEFWSNVCDEEYELQLRQQEVSEGVCASKSFACVLSRHKNKTDSQNEPVATTREALCRTSCPFSSND